MRFFFSKLLLELNRYLANRINQKLYFFFVKYIYTMSLLRPVDMSLKFSFDKEKNLFLAKSSKSKIGYYYNIERSNRYIFGGLDGIGKKLYEKYQLGNIKIDKNDIIIDIGCNIGELTYFLSRFEPTIYAFDIEQKALDCLKLNCSENKKIIVQKLAIWNKIGELEFDSKLNDASSTLLKPNNMNEQVDVQKTRSTTLDCFFEEKKIKRAKLVKVEAEGGEPEILYGALNSLKNIEFISLDCGPERYGKTTFKEVTKILSGNNFETRIFKNCCLGINKSLSN